MYIDSQEIDSTVNLIPKVSVVIPSYKRHLEVVAAIKSSTQQTLQPLEVIVVNDGPDKEKEKIIKSLAIDNVVYLEAPRTGLASATRNFGILHTNGDWIALLDDDDIWSPTKLASQFSSLKESGLSAAVLSGVEAVHTLDNKVFMRPKSPLPINIAIDKFMFGKSGGIHTSSLMAPAWLFKKLPFDESLKRHEDWKWILQASQELKFIITPDIVCHRYIKQGEQLSSPGCFEYSKTWYLNNNHLMSKGGKAEFVSRILSRKAAYDKNPSKVFWLINELIKCTTPGLACFPRMFIPWIIPSTLRIQLKNLFRKTDDR